MRELKGKVEVQTFSKQNGGPILNYCGIFSKYVSVFYCKCGKQLPLTQKC